MKEIGHKPSLIILRVVLGAILIGHGYTKLFGDMSQFTGFVGSVFPGSIAPAFFAWLVALLEFAGGIALVFGIGVKIVSLLVSLEFVVILLFYVRSKLGITPGTTPLELLILAAALTLLLNAPKEHGPNVEDLGKLKKFLKH
jgi:putative oxidoreductase